MPLLMIILQHPLEHLQSLRCGSRPTSWRNGTGWQRRSWEERIERKLVGHPSSEVDVSIHQFYNHQSCTLTRRGLNPIKSFGQYAWSVSRTDGLICSLETGHTYPEHPRTHTYYFTSRALKGSRYHMTGPTYSITVLLLNLPTPRVYRPFKLERPSCRHATSHGIHTKTHRQEGLDDGRGLRDLNPKSQVSHT